ncbi:hydroxyphenylacetyl-CoA thioesterase PaaI [Hoeflea sp. WL0058]|uniref:Hydroxyphenylacetyl-CoA thioesterase PaaI n=1 Tax=Flavimaribacter sediminis TaxID=2865987 RepID=A0AAE3D0N8_9HYPH|nr:hydroxyphenylacetyl-CoA thioesterase PaaI [Flavimaribacter sediminis]MBW8636893.1 hydroxyphenylacetyl-CoA thioesterase PaaI [Flavimaribacter sediminis]
MSNDSAQKLASAEDLAKASAEAMWREDRASQHMGMEIIDIGPGRATLRMPVQDHMVNGLDICHGGFVFTLADSTFAFACNSYNQHTVAQHCAVSFLQPARRGEMLTAVASEVHRTTRSGIYDIRVTRDDGTVVAEFRGHSRTIKGTHVPVAAE